MTHLVRIGCHGLGIIQPIDEVCAELDRETPHQPPFIIIGGADPRIEQAAREAEIIRYAHAGAEFVYIGHSLGAAFGFYLAQRYPAFKFRLIITVDPTSWGSNIDVHHTPQWATVVPHPGQWIASGDYDRWINIRTSQYPGGGRLMTQAPNCEDHHFPDCNHIGVILDPRVRKIIDPAVLAVK